MKPGMVLIGLGMCVAFPWLQAWAGEPEPAPAAGHIESLVQAVDHEDFEVREDATQELMGSCRPALKAVQKVLEAPPSHEARIRAERIAKTIMQRLRRASFKGGEIVRGLQATLRSEKDVFQAGETLSFELEVQNVSEQTTAFRGIDTESFHGGFDYDLPDREGPENWDNAAMITLAQLSGEKILKVGQMGGGCTCFEKVELKPAENILYPVVLLQTKDKERKGSLLVPGEYEISIFFYGKTRGRKELGFHLQTFDGVHRLPDDLKSNTIRFRVEMEMKEQK